jgi:anti-anti-sigma factor
MRIQKTRIVADIDSEQAVVRFMPVSVREMSEVQAIMDEIEEVSYNYKMDVMVLNFSRLKHLTSGFLGRLITLNKTLKQSEIELRVCCMTPDVERAFKICKLEKMIPLYESEEKALKG